MSQIEPRQIPISLPVTGDAEWQATRECFETGWLTSGPKVRAFEQAFAQRHQTKHAIAVTSATTALHLSLVALGVGPGDEVIVPAFTWVSTANVVLHCGASVVFVDVDLRTFNLDVQSLQQAITDRTKAIMAVHLFGLCVDIDAIQKIAGAIPIVEDAACAAGAAYRGRPAGSLGELGCFSFHPRKSITTGEGGMITTQDDQLADTITQLRNHGATLSEEQRHLGARPYLLPDFNLLGYNYRMTDVQGAIGLTQLTRLDEFIDERATWAQFYQEQLDGIPWLQTPRETPGDRHGWQAYVCLVDEKRAPASRNEIMQRLQEQGVSTRPGTHAVHMLNYYANRFGLRGEDFPRAKICNDFSMAIPLHNRMTADDYRYVVQCIRAIG
jgi:dTDP-4-amino-4,6-dideoxygalactose transaminase